MPTGYTAELVEKGQSFTEFALGCARAFGACVEQRDEPLSEMPKMPKLPTYHETSLIKEEANLAKLLAMTPKQRIAFGKKKQKADILHYQVGLSDKIIVRERIQAMIDQAQQYQQPTPDHEGFKNFMLQQLKSTLDFDGDVGYYVKQLDKATSKLPMDYYREAVETVERSIEYDKREIIKELERHDNKSKWLTQLFESLVPYDNGEITLKVLKQE